MNTHWKERNESFATLDRMKEIRRQTHDRDLGHTNGPMSAIRGGVGLHYIADMYQGLLLRSSHRVPQQVDIHRHPWDEGLETVMLMGCEAMRAHFVGLECTGHFQLIQTEDRYVFSFCPCGYGGSTLRGDAIEGSPPRMEQPYVWAVTNEPASQPLHAGRVPERRPLHRADGGGGNRPFRLPGASRRLTGPRRNRARRQSAAYRWSMFKAPTAVSEDHFERVGCTTPTVFGSSHFEKSAVTDPGALGPGTA